MKRKIFIAGCALAVLAAGALVVALLLASPAASQVHPGGGGDSDEYPWDTDNLRYGRYNAKSFNIPFHKYGGYSGVEACKSSVADGFFQTGSPDVVSTDEREDELTPEDFPVLVFSGGSWGVEAEASADNDSGYDSFVAQQERLKAQVAAGLGYALDKDGNLRAFSGGTAFSEGRTSADLSYVAWSFKGGSGYVTTSEGHGATNNSRYLERVDGHTIGRTYPRAISPDTATWSVPPNTSSTGHFSSEGWHGREVVVSNVSYIRVAGSHGLQSRYLTEAKSEALCRSGFHPRGEDSSARISGGTGRSLTGLSHAKAQIADRYWCRSDVRYLRSFKAEHHTNLGQNVIRHSDAAAAGEVFEAYGRLNCYYTFTGTRTLGNGGYVCEYMFPVPQCTDNGSKRDFTETELDGYTTGEAFTAADDGTTDCASTSADPPADPPQQAGFTADACVTADLEIYENRIAGSDAEPGVPASDRTLTTGTSLLPAWDLDITSPHPCTASPPRDATAGAGDPDGFESRTSHSALSGDALRKQSIAPLSEKLEEMPSLSGSVIVEAWKRL